MQLTRAMYLYHQITEAKPQLLIKYFPVKRDYKESLGLIKPFEATHESMKIKIYINFYFITTFWNAQGGKG